MAQPKTINVEARTSNPGKRLFFNTYQIDKVSTPGFLLLKFFFMEGRFVLDSYFCAIAWDDLKSQKEGFMAFISPFVGELAVSHQSAPGAGFEPDAIESADFMGLARHGVVGEIVLHGFSWKLAVDFGKTTNRSTVPVKEGHNPQADFVALLRCPFSLLVGFVAQLFDDSSTTIN